MTLQKYGRKEIIKKLTKEIAKCRDEEKWKECMTEKKEKWAASEDKGRTSLRNIGTYQTTGYPTIS